MGGWAVVTGASDGIGRAFAVELAGQGFDLVLAARRRSLLDALAADLTTRFGVEARAMEIDLSRPDAPAALLAATQEIDVALLVAAAGFGTSGPFLDGELAAELEMIDVNCRSAAALSHGFGRRMRSRGRGAIVLMSSLVAFQGVPGAANYAATKAYIQGLAEGLRRELKPAGVEVIASAPGPVHSGFGARAGMTMGMAGDPATVARVTLSALGRRGTVRPGFLSKTLEASLAPLPRWGRTMILQKVMAGMTAGKGGAA
jgi:short-subunit dehydrogenase